MQLQGDTKMDPVSAPKLKQVEPQSVSIERERKLPQLSSAQEIMFAFFRETPQLHVPKPEMQIRIDTVEVDNLGVTHVKGTQLFRGIPVYGMDFTFHISPQNERFMGCTMDTALIDVVPLRLNAEEAIRIAESDLSLTTVINAPTEQMKEMLNYERPVSEAIYYPVHLKAYRYCYKVVIRPNFRDEWIYYIDSNNSEVIEKYNNTPSGSSNMGTRRI